MPDAISYAGPELDELVRTLMACTPLHLLSSMEARTVFELLLQRGYRIVKVNADNAAFYAARSDAPRERKQCPV